MFRASFSPQIRESRELLLVGTIPGEGLPHTKNYGQKIEDSYPKSKSANPKHTPCQLRENIICLLSKNKLRM